MAKKDSKRADKQSDLAFSDQDIDLDDLKQQNQSDLTDDMDDAVMLDDLY